MEEDRGDDAAKAVLNDTIRKRKISLGYWCIYDLG